MKLTFRVVVSLGVSMTGSFSFFPQLERGRAIKKEIIIKL
jgi:hypothetical protein